MSNDIKVTTNRHWRPFRYRDEVPAAVLADRFDWLDADEVDGFFCYRGWWYHNSEFTAVHRPGNSSMTPHPLVAWDGVLSDSFYSGVVIKLSEDFESYMVGTYTC